jgi:hypothetical protein
MCLPPLLGQNLPIPKIAHRDVWSWPVVASRGQSWPDVPIDCSDLASSHGQIARFWVPIAAEKVSRKEPVSTISLPGTGRLRKSLSVAPKSRRVKTLPQGRPGT